MEKNSRFKGVHDFVWGRRNILESEVAQLAMDGDITSAEFCGAVRAFREIDRVLDKIEESEPLQDENPGPGRGDREVG